MGLCTQCESDRLHSSVADTRAQEAAFTVWSAVCLAVVRWLLFALTLTSKFNSARTRLCEKNMNIKRR